jgi:predicted nucleotidyltransferase
MKHDEILKKLVAEAESDPNVLGYLLFGSVARGTQREDSDIDVITILQANDPAWGINNTANDGIKVGDIFLTYSILADSVEEVPYLLHPLVEAKLLIDRDGRITPLLDRLKTYFNDHPEIVAEWNGYFQQMKQEKAQFGYEKTTIVDVWNELEKQYSGGKTRRRFFDTFYFTNPLIFSILKKFL